LKHEWLHRHLQCSAPCDNDFSKCPVTGNALGVPMAENQIIIQTTRVLNRFEPLRFRVKDSAGNCKVWIALINKVSP
jgi:hypothetical protein